jgi:hypothetical protein
MTSSSISSLFKGRFPEAGAGLTFSQGKKPVYSDMECNPPGGFEY